MGVSAVRFAVGTAITRTDIPALCAQLADLLRGQAGDLVECDVTGLSEPDLAAVDAVARLRLTAHRHGRRLVVIGADPDLLELFDLLGLTDLLCPEVLGPIRTRPESPRGSATDEAGTGETSPNRSATRETGTGETSPNRSAAGGTGAGWE
jgi:ABC-type transporter Mla MlaB component